MKPDRVVNCPKCHAEIQSLYYVVHKSVTGSYALDTGHEDNLGEDRDRIEYRCPKCDADLFNDEAQAEAFLLGEIASPAL
jgi:DNA-directed RNA polymerase subunit RPC12/RpoP